MSYPITGEVLASHVSVTQCLCGLAPAETARVVPLVTLNHIPHNAHAPITPIPVTTFPRSEILPCRATKTRHTTNTTHTIPPTPNITNHRGVRASGTNVGRPLNFPWIHPSTQRFSARYNASPKASNHVISRTRDSTTDRPGSTKDISDPRQGQRGAAPSM